MNNRILIVGSGVIGSIMGSLFSKSNQTVCMYARGLRLKELQEKGLLYYDDGEVKQGDVQIVDTICHETFYDFVFVTVRYEQIESALEQIKNVNCENIVTMVNNPNGYDKWGCIVGKGRIIPAFPGAGGKIENGILDFKITPRFIQTTILGEISGEKTERIERLASIFKKAGIPYTLSIDMEAWQKSHLALVLPLANGIYKDGGDNFTTSKNNLALRYMASSLKGNFSKLKSAGIKITPSKFHLLLYIPTPILIFCLRRLYSTNLAGTVICEHALNAKQEMHALDEGFTHMINR